jgi:hypothetical protein
MSNVARMNESLESPSMADFGPGQPFAFGDECPA